MIGLVAKFRLQNPLNFAQVDGRIKLLQVDDITGNRFRIEGLLTPPCLRPSISESFHAAQDKAPGFVTHSSPLHPGLPTALSCRLAKEDNGSNDLVIMLDGIDKLQPNLLKIRLSRHEMTPFRV